MSAEKPTNKPYPEDTEETGNEVGTPEQQSTEMRGTSDVVQSKPVPPALKELASEVNIKCSQLFEYFVRDQWLIFHPHREISRTIKRVVDEECSSARDEKSFYKCVLAYSVMIEILLGQTEHNENICELIHKLVVMEYRNNDAVVLLRNELDKIVDAVAFRLNIANDRVKDMKRDATDHITNGKLYIDVVLEKVRSLAVQRLNPLNFRNFVSEAEVNEFEGKLTIHVVLPKAGETPNAENTESFTIVNDLKKVGLAYLVDRDSEYWITDLSRRELLPPSPPKEKGNKAYQVIGNFQITIPSILLPAIDRFIRMGWIPDGTTTEFLDAIRDKIRIIKTPEEMFRDTLARVFSAFHWVVVEKSDAGEYILKSDIPVTPENPWQAYAYLLKEPKRTIEGITWLPTEIWVPYPLWQKMRETLERQRIPKNLIHAIVKSERVSRNAMTCGLERAIRMRNLVILDIERIKEYLNGDIEDYMVHIEPPCEGESE